MQVYKINRGLPGTNCNRSEAVFEEVLTTSVCAAFGRKFGEFAFSIIYICILICILDIYCQQLGNMYQLNLYIGFGHILLTIGGYGRM